MSSKRMRYSESANGSDREFIPTMQALTEAVSRNLDDRASTTEIVKRAAKLLEHNYYEAALSESQRVLELLHKDAQSALSHQSDVAWASVLRGKALLKPLVNKLARNGEEEDVIKRILGESRAAFNLALILHPENAEAKTELQEIHSLTFELFGEEGLDCKAATKICEAAIGEVRELPMQTSAAESLRKDFTAKSPDARELAEFGTNDRESVSSDIASRNDLDVIIVGAGASGVGVSVALLAQFGIDRDRMLVLERGASVGTSFRLWPKEMRFISPSFNQQGWTGSFDLNSIANGTSPATYTLEEHPTGESYAKYLEGVSHDVSLPINFGVDVTRICPVGSPGDPRFEVHVKQSSNVDERGEPVSSVDAVLYSRFVIWAAGEFQYPKRSGTFPGAELCCHNSTVRSWAAHPGDEFIVIGGYESGIDAAVNLVSSDRPVTVLASSPCWEESSRDPSGELAPYTRGRLRQTMSSQYSSKLQLLGSLRVTRVEYDRERYWVHAVDQTSGKSHDEQTNTVVQRPAQRSLHEDVSLSTATSCVFSTSSPPILSVGFEGSIVHMLKDLFDWEQADDSNHGAGTTDAEKSTASCGSSGHAILTEEDESTTTEGLFLVGPQVSHEGLIFCFVYKFRQRFAVVAAAISRRLGKDTRLGVLACRSADMFLDDFVGIHACCGKGSQDK